MKRKLTAAEKRAKRERKRTTRIIFINGKQKRVPREPTIDGMPVDEFIRRNADPIWLHMNEMWELMPEFEGYGSTTDSDEFLEQISIADEGAERERFDPRHDDWDSIPDGHDDEIPF